MTSRHWSRSALLICGAALVGLQGAGSTETNAGSSLVPQAPIPLPGYLSQVRDTASGTMFTRITKPGSLGNGVACGKDYCSHRYSSAQAWNADQSLLVITNGCNGMCFLDGQTYRPLFKRDRSSECEWHPQDAALMICVDGKKISTWAPRSNAEDVLFTAKDYSDLHFGPGKGNPSRDGNRIAVRAVRKDGAEVVFGYDLKQRRKFIDIPLGQLAGVNDTCSISPLGVNIVCLQELDDGTEQAAIFSINGTAGQKWTQNHRPGHGDMSIDDDGSEVYVGISKSDPDKNHVIKRRLSDGGVTSLVGYGEASHASMRALAKPDWVFLSFGGNPVDVLARPEMAPYAREIFALRIDGMGEVRRIAQTRSVDTDYRSETHASPSPDGSQVIWSSNWGIPGGPVYDFVTRVDWSKSPDRKEIVENGTQ